MFEFLSALIAVVVCIGILCIAVYGPTADKPWIPAFFGGEDEKGAVEDIEYSLDKAA